MISVASKGDTVLEDFGEVEYRRVTQAVRTLDGPQ